MEFERAIYRVYERSIEGLLQEEESTRPDAPFYSKSCRLFEIFLLCMGMFLFVTLILVHSTFVGSTGCLSDVLTFVNHSTNQSHLYHFSSDQILGIYLEDTFLKQNSAAQSQGILRKDGNNDDLPATTPQQRNSIINRRNLLSFIPFYLKQDISSSSSSSEKFSQLSFSPRLLLEHNNTDNSTSSNGSPGPNYNFDYIITFNEAVTLMDWASIKTHRFQVINVTLSGSDCFGGKNTETLLALGGVDIAILNFVMFTTKRPGFMLNLNNELYHWRESDLITERSLIDWLFWKIGIIGTSLMAFFLLSTTTALLVRVIISSGVVIIFPLFHILRYCGVRGLSLRIISLSYPWIGLPLQLIQSRQQSATPFVCAHLTRMAVYYLLYMAAQSVYLQWFYNDTSYGVEQLWLYAVMMLWEYYSMIYLRSEMSIRLFPRASLALFLMLHFYYYSFPSGFHLLALSVMFAFLVLLMSYCVRVYEVKAFRMGLVSFDQPRMLYNSLPWPSWRADIAPDYTIFMPVNAQQSTVYQNTVPAPPNAVNNNTNVQHPQAVNTAGRGSTILPFGGIANRLFSSTSATVSQQAAIETILDHQQQQQHQSVSEQASETQTSLGTISQFFRPRNYQSISTTESTHNSIISTTVNVTHANNEDEVEMRVERESTTTDLSAV